MNSKQAKQLSLPQIMSRLGYEPTEIKKGGNEYWYKSPFREEKEASFHTSFLGGKWIWNDFGDIGGTVIDFVMRHENYNQVRDALQFLDKMFQPGLFEKPVSREKRGGENPQQPNLFSFQQQASGPQARKIFSDSELSFLKAHKIENPFIHRYLASRGIPKELADRYLVEVKYHNHKNGRDYFAFGMVNASDGYEIRAASDAYSFKSALNGRDISFFSGTGQPSPAVQVFEGMTDFLSYLVLTQQPAPVHDCLIMHSLSSFKRTVTFIEAKGYRHIHTFLDNDKSGQVCTEKFAEAFKGRVEPQNTFFAPHKDLNTALMAKGISHSPIR